MKKSSLLVVLTVVIGSATLYVVAQEQTGPQPVLIERRAIQLSSADRYRTPLQLLPGRGVVLTAPFDGLVERVERKAGSRAEAQFEIVKIANDRAKLTRVRATAALDLAEIKLRQAQTAGNKDSVALAEAEVKLAEAEVRLAEYDEKAASIRAPYGGTVLDVFVQPGQQVKKGQKIAYFGDLGQVRCRVPVKRDETKVGQTIQLNVENRTVSARVEAIVALTEELQQLRELSVSVALADVVIDNVSNTLKDGQSVFAPLVPNHPVTRVPLDVLKTDSGGGRAVQVLRENTIRTIPVSVHGQDGKTDVFVSGPFTEHDEVLLSVSVDLADGTAVRPSSADRFSSASSPATTSSEGTPTGTTPPKRKTGAAGF